MRRRRLSDDDHAALQARLLMCAGDRQHCESISSWVVQAMRPAHSGRRTDITLFGLCEAHRDDWRDAIYWMGYERGILVEWAGVGSLLEEMDDAGLLRAG